MSDPLRRKPCRHDGVQYHLWGAVVAREWNRWRLVYLTCPRWLQKHGTPGIKQWLSDPRPTRLFVDDHQLVWILWPDPGCEL